MPASACRKGPWPAVDETEYLAIDHCCGGVWWPEPKLTSLGEYLVEKAPVA